MLTASIWPLERPWVSAAAMPSQLFPLSVNRRHPIVSAITAFWAWSRFSASS